MKKVLIVGAVCALLGIGVGSASGEAPKPETVTKTETVTREVEVEVTPQACLDAIDAAEKVGGITQDFINSASAYPDLVVRAAKAGMNFDAAAIEGITTEIEGLTEDFTGQAKRMRPTVAAFNAAKTDCRASAS
jgi:hypothetical protein